MEMADYERLVKELNAKLLEKDECVEELKAQISTLTQREGTLEQEIGLHMLFWDVHLLSVWKLHSVVFGLQLHGFANCYIVEIIERDFKSR